jgi:hypothetical protein
MRHWQDRYIAEADPRPQAVHCRVSPICLGTTVTHECARRRCVLRSRSTLDSEQRSIMITGSISAVDFCSLDMFRLFVSV